MNIKLHYLLVPLIFSSGLAAQSPGESRAASSQDDDELNMQLIEAAKSGSTELMIDLLRRGADVNARSDVDSTALHEAAFNGHVDCVRALIAAQALVNIFESKFGSTPLHWAARAGKVDCISALMEAHADVTLLDNMGHTASYYAEREAHTNCTKTLCHVKDDEDITAFRSAALEGSIDTVRALVKNSYQRVPSASVVSESRKRISDVLLQLNRVTNDRSGSSRVEREIMNSQILSANEIFCEDLAIIVLDELNKKREIRDLVLVKAKDEAVSYLLKKLGRIISQLDLSMMTPAMRTLLDLAKLKENFGALIKEGIEERCNELKEQREALHNAAKQGDLERIKALITSKANLDAQNHEKATALHWVARTGYVHCLEALLKANADSNVRYSNGALPLQIAIVAGHIDCIKTFIKYSYLMVPSKKDVTESRKRIYNVLLTLGRFTKPHKEGGFGLTDLRNTSLQFEILSKDKSLQDDLVIILLDELKKGREIKPGLLSRSKEAAVEYLLEKVRVLIAECGSAKREDMQTLFDSSTFKETFGALIREGLNERCDLLKAKRSE